MQQEHPIHIFINKKKYEIDNPIQTGASLKNLAGIPLSDVLFLQRPGEDEVIPNDTKITLKNGDHLHSQPQRITALERPFSPKPALLPTARFCIRRLADGSFL
jgi:hypothetical protein